MTKVTSRTRTGVIRVGSAEIYHEVRGQGPAILFVSGATGDAGHWERVVGNLARDHTVVTYDRRGNSRSPKPEGWAVTTAGEQADDAAGLIDALGLAPATVVGNSGGAIIGLSLLMRHPRLLRSVILHEPPLLSVLADPDAVLSQIQLIAETGMAEGGPCGAARAFLGFAAGDAVKLLDPVTYERMTSNGEVLFGIEFGALESYRPTDEELAANAVPSRVLLGVDSAPFFGEAARWLAARLGQDVIPAPGAHVPMMSHPDELAELVRSLAAAPAHTTGPPGPGSRNVP